MQRFKGSKVNRHFWKKLSLAQNKAFVSFSFFLFSVIIGRLHTTNSGHSGLSAHFLMFLRLQMVFRLYWVLRTSWCVPGEAGLEGGSDYGRVV